jgi:hypothetical protein
MRDEPASGNAGRFDHVERLLDERGNDLGIAGARVAAGRSGLALGFPRDPMVHVSWWALSAAVLGRWLWRRRRG